MSSHKALRKRYEALAELLEAGVALDEAIESFVPSARDEEEAELWRAVVKAIRQGKTLARALEGKVELLGRGADRALDVKEEELAAACRSLAAVVEGEPVVDSEPETDPAFQRFLGWIRRAVEEKASDLHVEPHGAGGRIRFRLQGRLVEKARIDAAEREALVGTAKRSFHGSENVRDLPQDGKLILAGEEGQAIILRLCITPWIGGESLAVRFASRQAPWEIALPELASDETLGARLVSLADSREGLVVICGPTGSGKTTTLYAMVGRRNRDDQTIVSVEDPVECRIPGVNQLQVDPVKGFEFIDGLRAAFRMDADVIVAGELRDRATAQALLQAALTGHAAFTQLHGTDAVSGLQRLLDVGLDPLLLGDGLTAVVGQRLVGRLCPHCRCEDERSVEERSALDPRGLLDGTTSYRRGSGCERCCGGFTGALAVHEVLTMTPTLRKALGEGLRGQALRDVVAEEAFEDMGVAGLRLVARGLTSLSEVQALERAR